MFFFVSVSFAAHLFYYYFFSLCLLIVVSFMFIIIIIIIITIFVSLQYIFLCELMTIEKQTKYETVLIFDVILYTYIHITRLFIE